MTAGARWRSLRSSQQLPTYIVVAAVVVGVIVLAVRRNVVNVESLIFFGAFIPAVIFHEVSHGVVALWLGDDTAKRAGRLTLNPLKHVDPFGSIILPAILALTGSPILGWAKPVPVAVNRLRHPRNSSVLVGLAGPATNIVLATLAGIAFHELYLHAWPLPTTICAGGIPCASIPAQWGLGDQILFEFGVVNVLLAAFNMIPIPPLDGSALVERLLPASALPGYYRMRMGFMLVVLVLVLFDQGLLGRVLGDVENWYFNRIF